MDGEGKRQILLGMTNDGLKDMLRESGLPVGGNKAQLV